MHDIAGDPPYVNSQSQSANRKFAITVMVEPDGSPMRLEGRVAWAMRQLVNAGKNGCTPITHPGPRWSDYTHKLRKLGFVIETEYESHGGPFAWSHGIYRLRSPVIRFRRQAIPMASLSGKRIASCSLAFNPTRR